MKHLLIGTLLLALSGCMSVSGLERSIDAWKFFDLDTTLDNKVNALLGERRSPAATKRVGGPCADYEGHIQLWCNCDNPIAADPESIAFASCMEPYQ